MGKWCWWWMQQQQKKFINGYFVLSEKFPDKNCFWSFRIIIKKNSICFEFYGTHKSFPESFPEFFFVCCWLNSSRIFFFQFFFSWKLFIWIFQFFFCLFVKGFVLLWEPNKQTNTGKYLPQLSFFGTSSSL